MTSTERRAQTSGQRFDDEDIEQLRGENHSLSEQVKRLIRVEAELNSLREYLDNQVHLYRRLYELGKRFSTIRDEAEIIEAANHFVIYELGFERCLILTRSENAAAFGVRSLDGYYDDDGDIFAHASISADDPAVRPALAGSPYVMYRGDAGEDGLGDLAATVGMDEYVLLPLGGEPGNPGGLLVAGNTASKARYYARVEPDSETLIGLGNLVSQATAALNNVLFYRQLEEERQLLEKKVEERTHLLSEVTRAAEAANRSKSDFLASMSHELRTPLNAIIGFSEVLSERMFGELNDKQADYLADILSSGKHLLALINDVLDLSKIEAGRMELDVAWFSLPELLDNAVVLVKERATRQKIALTIEIAPELDLIEADQRKLKQILANLLSNAVKSTDPGGRVDVVAQPHNGDAVEITVSDTGIGIAPEEQDEIFEEFRQAGTGTSRAAEGTGLGLTLTKKFVELHGGRIWVKSELGTGSTFGFMIPMRQAAPSTANQGAD